MTEPDDRHKDTGEKSDTVMKESAYKTKDIGSLDTVKTQGADKEPVHAESKEPESEAGRESARIVNKESKSGADTELAHSESKEPVSRVSSDSTQSVSKEPASGIIPGQASNEDVGSPQVDGSEAVPDAPPKKKKKKKKVKKKKIKKKKLPPKVIVAENLGVRFRIQEQKVDSLKEYFVRLIKRKLNYRDFWALREVNLKIRKGDRVGILGLNGAGKSTLLKCIAGVLKPTEGTVTVKGNIVPLLELGAGFDKDYTGAENIYFYGSMLGYSRSFIKERFKEIVDFSELGSFINVPVKNYSSGMKARLGFSIATVVDPEILILDEVLSVGDAKFRKKSAKKLSKMMKQGVTVLFVSHSTDQVLANCNKAIILEQGHVVASGKAEKICAKYEKMLADGSD